MIECPQCKLENQLLHAIENKRVWQQQAVKLTAQLKTAIEERDTHNDFMAFMSAELSAWPCCHENGEHSDSPPIMWPELIGCIVKKATESALSRAVVAEKEREIEIHRVKACEHIAEGEEGWEVLTNECPSTAAVASLRVAFTAIRKEHDEEKTRRTYYQSIVYDVCNKIDNANNHRTGHGIVCGTKDASSRDTQSALAKLIAERDELHKDKITAHELLRYIRPLHDASYGDIVARINKVIEPPAIDAASKPTDFPNVSVESAKVAAIKAASRWSETKPEVKG